MQYHELVGTYEKLESTTKRLEKTFYIAELLAKASTDDLEQLTLLLQGIVFPSYDPRKIGFASRMLIKAVNIATGLSTDEVEKEWKNTGDLGDATKNLVARKKQVTLFSESLTVKKVFDNIRKLSELEGTGTVDKKIKLTAELLTSAKPVEAKYIARTLLEDLRVGAAAGTLRDSITLAFFPRVIGITAIELGDSKKKFKELIAEEKPKTLEANDFSEVSKNNLKDYDFILCKDEKKAREIYNRFSEMVQEAIDVSNDFGIVAKALKEKGVAGLTEIKLNPGRPIKVMLYPKAKGIADAFKTVGKPAAFEYKLDGFRLQIHKSNGKITLFTRRLENVTKQFPDVVEVVKDNVDAENFVLDSEIIGFDKKTGKFRSFQQISQRIKRKYDIDKLIQEVPVVVEVFDIIELNGKNMIKEPFQERRAAIKSIVNEKKEKIELVQQLITSDVDEAEKFYEDSLNKGNEGIMAKNLEGVYKPGARVGYGMKIKPVMETLDLVIVGAEWGSGKRSQWLSSFIVACVDDEGDFLEIGRFGTGIKELEESEGTTFDEFTTMLKPLIKKEKGRIVEIKPSVVVELKYEEIQKSPTYGSGYALRFPRLVRLRSDRGADEISTLDDVEELYSGQRGR